MKETKREIRKENFFRGCLVWRGEGKKIVESGCFLPEVIKKKFSPKWGENWIGRNLRVNDKIAHVHAHGFHPIAPSLFFKSSAPFFLF